MKRGIMNQQPNWMIHYVSNYSVCEICGLAESRFPDRICDAHTHGMYQYGHLEFQVVIDYGPEEVSRLLNTMGRKVQAGQHFQDGDQIEGLYLDCKITLCEMSDAQGKTVLRLMIPDRENQMPMEAQQPYNLQILSTQMLYKNNN